MIVTFGEPIGTLDAIFEDVKRGGLFPERMDRQLRKHRFTPIGADKAVITSEYNMDCVKEWLEHNTPVKDIVTC